MAIIYEDECVSCPKELGCLGSACPNRNVKHYICDKCEEDVDKLYIFEGRELCIDCIINELEEVE